MRGLKLQVNEGRLQGTRFVVARSAPLMRGLKPLQPRGWPRCALRCVARSAPLMRGLKPCCGIVSGFPSNTGRAVCPANEGIETLFQVGFVLHEELHVARSAPLMRGLKQVHDKF